MSTSAVVKAANYTPEQTARARTDYANNIPVAEIAAALGKSVKSVVAKLSREGVYKKAEYKTKAGEKVVKKDAHASAIGAVLRLSEADVDSLTKANKSALVAIFEALSNSKPAAD